MTSVRRMRRAAHAGRPRVTCPDQCSPSADSLGIFEADVITRAGHPTDGRVLARLCSIAQTVPPTQALRRHGTCRTRLGPGAAGGLRALRRALLRRAAFAKSADFAINKPAGKPCPNLRADFRCGIHEQLEPRGFPGCTVFDCFGAGQHLTQVTFGGRDWRSAPDIAGRCSPVLPIMRQLHELLWYLTEALTLDAARRLHPGSARRWSETERLTEGTPAELRRSTWTRTGGRSIRCCSRPASWRAPGPAGGRTTAAPTSSAAGCAGADLRGANLRGALLIGADLRAPTWAGRRHRRRPARGRPARRRPDRCVVPHRTQLRAANTGDIDRL